MGSMKCKENDLPFALECDCVGSIWSIGRIYLVHNSKMRRNLFDRFFPNLTSAAAWWILPKNLAGGDEYDW